MLEARRLRSIELARPLLERCGLQVNPGADYTAGVYEGEELVATGSLNGDMIQMMAVSPDHQGEDLSAMVLTHLVNYAFSRGKTALHLFTKPQRAENFTSLGFRLVARAEPYAALLEFGKPGIEEFCAHLRQVAAQDPGPASALVMNCNPFTLGHQYLAEQAAARSRRVYLLAVEEDKSEFPFAHRMELIRQGTAHLPNLTVLSGGRYAVSSLTFPSYFTKEENLAYAHCAIDLEIFARHLAPALGVNRRFVGTEPYSPVTAIYNRTMLERLPAAGIEVVELPRIQQGGEAVSASRVRALLQKGRLEAVRELVPRTTYDYLLSDRARPVLERLRERAEKEETPPANGRF